VIVTLLFAAACTSPSGGGASAPGSTPEAPAAASPGASAPVTSDDYGY
jgi:hypothetical protein